jgi:predicted Zn-dependent protease
MKGMRKILTCLVFGTAALAMQGQNGYDNLLRAVSLAGSGRVTEAAGLLSAMEDINRDATLLVIRGDIFLRASMTAEARSDFMKAENLVPGAGLYGLAKCAAAGGDTKTAVSLLESHLKSPLRKSEPEIMLDDAFKGLSSTPEWRALWKKDWYKGYERMNWEIDHYLKSGRPDLAEGVFTDLSSLYPGLPVTDYCNARILISKGRYREAAAILSGLTAGSDAPAGWLYTLAEAREGEGDFYAAATVYGRLISARYPDPGLLIKKARMLIRSGDREAAKKEMQRYIAIDPDNTEALGLIGRTYAEEGAIYEALPYLNDNVDKHPGEASAFRLRGDAWLAARTWDKAADDYTMSLDLDPEDGRVNLNLAIALINSGKSQDACYYLRKAKSLGVKEATDYLSKYCIR